MPLITKNNLNKFHSKSKSIEEIHKESMYLEEFQTIQIKNYSIFFTKTGLDMEVEMFRDQK